MGSKIDRYPYPSIRKCRGEKYSNSSQHQNCSSQHWKITKSWKECHNKILSFHIKLTSKEHKYYGITSRVYYLIVLLCKFHEINWLISTFCYLFHKHIIHKLIYRYNSSTTKWVSGRSKQCQSNTIKPILYFHWLNIADIHISDNSAVRFW